MWGAISKSARKLGDKAADQAKIAKIKADMLLIDRSIDGRKRAFGVAMYDYLSPLSQSPDFYAANDKLTEIVRPILILAQKEIQALAAKRVKQKEALAQAEAQRHAAFPTKAETYGQKLVNFGKAGYLHSGETKIKTEISVTERLIKGHKEDFGVTLYEAFAAAEDNSGFLPTDRQIRNVYDTCRQDLTVLEQKKKAKEDEIVELGGKRTTSETPTVQENYATTNPSAMSMSSTAPTYDSTSSYNAPPSYSAPTAPQSSPFPNTTQQPANFQVAGTGMFSHPVPTSGGYSDNVSSMAPPADPFSTNNSQGYSSPSPMTSMTMNAPAPDPFASISSPMFNTAQQPKQSNPTDLLDF